SALAMVRRHEPAVVTMDLGLPPRPDDPTEGLQLLEDVHGLAPDTKVIVLTGQNDRANALKAIALGAYDFCEKPFEPVILTLMIERAFRLHALQEENRRLQAQQHVPAMAGIVTRDPGMQRICRTVEKIAPTSATLLILGESGTGKELLARALHDLSLRHGNRFVALNCAAIPETLLESELFGYEKGAFTDARAAKAGILEIASGGSIFLDEIGEMPLTVQAKLLRVQEEQTFRRLGGVRDIQVDLRVVAATNRKLTDAIQEGKFRLDLYYRLNVIQVVVPALRDRKEDIIPLAEHFIRIYNTKFK